MGGQAFQQFRRRGRVLGQDAGKQVIIRVQAEPIRKRI